MGWFVFTIAAFLIPYLLVGGIGRMVIGLLEWQYRRGIDRAGQRSRS